MLRCRLRAVATTADPAGARSLGGVSNLELRHLAALAAVAEAGTFARAAARLGYTQSAVSQQIATLERTIGGAVFDRPGGPRPVRLTPLGKLLLGHAQDILARAQATADALERFRSGEAGRVDIGTFQSVSNVLLPPILTRLRDEHPGADIRLYEDEESAVSKVLAGELDLCFGVGPASDDVETIALLDDPYVLVARRGEHPPGTVTLEVLDGAQMVAFPPVCDMDRIEISLASRGVRPVTVFRSVDNGTVVAMVRAGMGSAIMPLLAVDIDPSDEQVCMHALDPAIEPRRICVMWEPNRTLSPLAARLLDLAVEVCRDLATRESTYHALAVASS
jgi:DNA-binding transcriptional LysR family regulator